MATVARIARVGEACGGGNGAVSRRSSMACGRPAGSGLLLAAGSADEVCTEGGRGRSLGSLRRGGIQGRRRGRSCCPRTKRRRVSVSASSCSSKESSTNVQPSRVDGVYDLDAVLGGGGPTPTWAEGQFQGEEPVMPPPTEEGGPSNAARQNKGKGIKRTVIRQKLSNFSWQEDVYVVKSWLEVSCDPITNTSQKKDRFWPRVLQQYNLKRGRYPERSVRSVQSRWDLIKAKVSKFAGFYAEVLHRNQSGMTDDDKAIEAAANYAVKHGSYFPYMHCWKILKNEPKWMEIRPKRVPLSIETDPYTDLVPGEPDTINQSAEQSTQPPSARKRPLGQNSSKAARKKGCSSTPPVTSDIANSLHIVTRDKLAFFNAAEDRRAIRHEEMLVIERQKLNMMANLLQEKIRLKREALEYNRQRDEEKVRFRKEALEYKRQMYEERILAINLDSCTEKLRLYYEVKQEEILRRVPGSH